MKRYIKAAIFEEIRKGETSLTNVAVKLGLESDDGKGSNKNWLVHNLVQEMVREGTVVRTSRGVYEVAK